MRIVGGKCDGYQGPAGTSSAGTSVNVSSFFTKAKVKNSIILRLLGRAEESPPLRAWI